MAIALAQVSALWHLEYVNSFLTGFLHLPFPHILILISNNNHSDPLKCMSYLLILILKIFMAPQLMDSIGQSHYNDL